MTEKVEVPNIVIGIHPGLHAEGVYEFWEPTLEVKQNILTLWTFLACKQYYEVESDDKVVTVIPGLIGPKRQDGLHCPQRRGVHADHGEAGRSVLQVHLQGI